MLVLSQSEPEVGSDRWRLSPSGYVHQALLLLFLSVVTMTTTACSLKHILSSSLVPSFRVSLPRFFALLIPLPPLISHPREGKVGHNPKYKEPHQNSPDLNSDVRKLCPLL